VAITLLSPTKPPAKKAESGCQDWILETDGSFLIFLISLGVLFFRWLIGWLKSPVEG
jgi:hypothetical protein